MLKPHDYLRITLPEAREQWLAIERRSIVEQGRQVNFTPVETLLSLAASLLVNHRQYGGSTSHRAAEPVPALARLFRRPNSSILAKMANLDGSRSNGAKHELEVACWSRPRVAGSIASQPTSCATTRTGACSAA